MQLAFSTLGCPEWTFDEVLAQATRCGFAGIEFRGLLDHVDLPQAPEFAPARIAETRRRLRDAGLAAACLSSSVTVVAVSRDEVDRRQAIATAQAYIEMAKELDAPFVRLFCGELPAEMLPAEAIERATMTLRTIGDFAQARGVTAVVETHDAFVESARLVDLIRLTNHPAVRILWDIHHPYRLAGEGLMQTVAALNGYVRYTHVKDSVLNDDGERHSYVLTGRGDVPIKEALRALQRMQYDGYLTLEWEKRWHPTLDPPEIAFPHYVQQMRAWMGELGIGPDQ